MRTTTVPRGAQDVRSQEPRAAAVRSAVSGRGDAGAAVRGSAGGPLSGTALLERLRVTGRARPAADPEFAAELRTFLEDGLAGPIGPAAASRTGRLLMTRDRLSHALACPVHRSAAWSGEPTGALPGGRTGEPRTFSTPLACGALVGALFRQIVAVGGTDDPMADALEALSLDDRQAPLVDWIRGLPAAEWSGLAAEVDRQAAGLLERWPTLDATWLPRTQEMLRAQLADGAVELGVRVDLAVGRPNRHEASVALLDVVSGARRPGHADDRRFAALVAALRGPVPPFAVATYYSRTGELDVDPVDHEYLVAAAQRCLAAATVLLGGERAPSDGSTCAACRPLLRRPPVVVAVDGAVGAGGSTGARGPEHVDPAIRVHPVDPVVAFPQVAAA